MADKEYKFPPFDDLPKVKDMPQGSIWGFFDKDGEKDEVGSQFEKPPPISQFLLVILSEEKKRRKKTLKLCNSHQSPHGRGSASRVKGNQNR